MAKDPPQLPEKYRWLHLEEGPRILKEALKLYGTYEWTEGSNPVIMRWADEVGGKIDQQYTSDDVPWCGLFMAVVAKRANYQWPENGLWALSWSAWGKVVPKDGAFLGDVLVFTRSGGGHVGIYVGEDDTAFHVLGGNQNNMVNITRISKTRLYAVRRSPFRIAMPPNCRKIRLSAKGQPLSKNEA